MTRLCCLGAVVSASIAVGGALRQTESPVLFREGFDDSRLSDRGWYDGRAVKIARTNAFAGTGCIEYHWTPGTTTPESSSALRHLFPPTDTVYVRFHMRLSKGWNWTGRTYHPHLMHFMTTENDRFHGPAASHLTLYIEPQEGKLRLAAQDIENEHSKHGLTQGPLRGGYNGRFYDSRDVLFRDDHWHCVEALFKLNSLDRKTDKPNADGIVRGLFDGKLEVDRSDVVLRSTDFPAMKFNQFLLAPYFGEGLLPHDQTLWIDELEVGTERLGPAVSARAERSARAMTTESATRKHRTYTTTFRRAQNPIAEGGRWSNGRTDALDWADVRTTPGRAFGSESGRIKYDDSTALLTGTWGPDQTAEATVFTRNQSQAVFEEVELRLRSSLSGHKATGYEILFRCLKTGQAYCQIVRWNGPLGDFTYVGTLGGAGSGVADGDVVKATIVGNVITAYINGEQVLQAKDDTYASGSPGMGFYLEGDPSLNSDFGFTRFSASD